MRGHDIDYKTLPQAEGRIQLLWVDGWWDGPLNGMCEYKGERLYYDLASADNDDNSYHYVLFRLSPEQLQQEEERHRDFVEYVGNHYSYPPGENKRYGHDTMKPQSEWDKFYNKHKDESPHVFVKEQAVVWCSDYKNFWPEGVLSPCFT